MKKEKSKTYLLVYLFSIFIILLIFYGSFEIECEADAAGLIGIRISPNVEVNEDTILLGKIAEIEGAEPILNQKLKDIVVATSPLPGRSRTLEKQTFKMRLIQNKINLSQLSLEIPAKVVVTRSYVEVSAERIKTLVSGYIEQNVFKKNADGRIRDIQVADRLLLPNGTITFKVIPPRNRDMFGKIPFSVQFNVNGKFYKRIWAIAKVELMTEVVFTKKPLGRHKPITESDIELRKMDLSKLPSDVITDPDSILGKRTRRAIGSNTAMRANLIEYPPLVKRGDVVVILAESDGLRITALGQVKKKGRFGESIPVMNYDSKKVVYARVIDSNTVKVEF
ncbi:MAG: flagellar basal body P-ring formation chaperone FlgA [Desulfobacterales bacterium]|jgi:flagella basal body P-ring formation protein FlgA